MKRKAVLKGVKDEAKRRGLSFWTEGLTRHTGVHVGNSTRTLGRHSEIDGVTAGKFFDQFADEFEKGWWR